MEKMEKGIILIDSGVTNSDDYPMNVMSGIELKYSNNDIVMTYDTHDSTGHGTNCAYCISLNTDTPIFPIKIFNDNNSTSTELLLSGLYIAYDLPYQIINLSLSASEPRYYSEIDKVIDGLTSIGKIVICSENNSKFNSYPARHPKILGIRGSVLRNNHQYWFNPNSPIQIIADSTPIFTGDINTQSFFGGNSKATAIFCGILSKYITMYPSKPLVEILKDNAAKLNWESKEINNREYYPCFYTPNVPKKKLLNEICNFLKEYCIQNNKPLDDSLDIFDPLFPSIITPDTIYKFKHALEEYFYIKIPISQIDFFTFYTKAEIAHIISFLLDEYNI